jgi:hypothetical protein
MDKLIGKIKYKSNHNKKKTFFFLHKQTTNNLETNPKLSKSLSLARHGPSIVRSIFSVSLTLLVAIDCDRDCETIPLVSASTANELYTGACGDKTSQTSMMK